MTIEHNFLPAQYDQTNAPAINHNYLREQFADYKEIFAKIERLVQQTDYTLGREVDRFESRICELTGAKHAVGVGSGTDALMLSLIALGVGRGHEVITTPYTFFSTIGAIVTAGARPVFVDIGPDYNIDSERIEAAITKHTRAILPVHWSGAACRMDHIMSIAKRHGLVVVEDACHAINGLYKGQAPGTYGDAGCFSMHPLKNLNVWGDGGYLVTDSSELHDRLVLLRNHGLINRNEQVMYGYNSRLDTLQAVVANHLLDKIDQITDRRIENAAILDAALRDIPQITLPPRDPDTKQVYHIFCVRAQRRDELVAALIKAGIDAKIHYPIPMHLQKAAADYGYKRGDFPVAEAVCASVLSLPVHEFMKREQLDFIAEQIRAFY